VRHIRAAPLLANDFGDSDEVEELLDQVYQLKQQLVR